MKNHVKLSCKLQGKSFVITSILMMFFLSNVYAQNATVTQSATSTKIKSAEWQLLISNEFVDVSYRYAECNLPSMGTHNENVYLQIKNKTDKKIQLEWNIEYWYNGKCNGCEAGNVENHKTIVLNPNETIEGSCSEKCNLSLKITSKMLNRETKSQLTDFNLKEVKVTPIVK